MDEKQKALIRSWRKLAETQDSYNAFIARWIAFNAYCSAMYAGQAQRLRCDLSKGDVLQICPEQPALQGTLKKESDRVTIDITAPMKLELVIRERYTEELIFKEFAREHASEYRTFCSNNVGFQNALRELCSAIEKRPGEFFVINMAKANQFSSQLPAKMLAGQKIIVMLSDVQDLAQVKEILYQIRCNVFHGEKVPNENGLSP